MPARLSSGRGGVIKFQVRPQYNFVAGHGLREQAIVIQRRLGDSVQAKLEPAITAVQCVDVGQGKAVRFGEEDVERDGAGAESRRLLDERRHAIPRPRPLAKRSQALFIHVDDGYAGGRQIIPEHADHLVVPEKLKSPERGGRIHGKNEKNHGERDAKQRDEMGRRARPWTVRRHATQPPHEAEPGFFPSHRFVCTPFRLPDNHFNAAVFRLTDLIFRWDERFAFAVILHAHVVR